MSFNLMGSEFPFFRLVTKQADSLRTVTGLLCEAFRSHPHVAEATRKIHAEETRAIGHFREIIRQLSLTYLHPVERSDIHSLGYAHAEALYAVRKISVRLGMYGVTEIRPAALQLSDNLAEAAEAACKMTAELETALDVSAYRKRFDALLAENDMVLLVALGELYEAPPPDTASLMEFLKWAQLYERFEEAAIRVHRVGLSLESIILKNF